MKRKHFLQTILGASIGANLPKSIDLFDTNSHKQLLKSVEKPVDGSMYGFADMAINKVKVGIIGCGNRGKSLIEMFPYLIEKGYTEIVALCDIRQEHCNKAAEKLSKYQGTKPQLYGKNENDWQQLVKQDNVDLVLICTPWRWHTPMALYGMEHGKHVACEVPIAYTMEDCWKLVETAEKTRRHCIMIENCCYNDEELWLLNMVQQGVFGDITHTEGAYLHDLRAHLLSEDYYEGQWRLMQHKERDGNFYTTHGLGPCSMYLDIGRGDRYDHLTSMSSRELNLSETAKKQGSNHTNITCGDLNTTMIKTAKGKSIMLQFDVHTGRPYSRINKLVGTQAVHDGYPSKLYVDNGELIYWGHKWLEPNEYEAYKDKYRHPMIKRLKSISDNFKQGHGGMDFVMMYRLIRCLNLGLPLDLNVYDGVMWSAITPLSELSVASKSASVDVPDFTGGLWEKHAEIEIMRDI